MENNNHGQSAAPGIGHKVRRLDRDIHGISEMLADISTAQRQHGDTLDGLDLTTSDISRRLQGHRDRLDRLGSDIRVLSCRMSDMAAARRAPDERLLEMDAKLDSIIELIRKDQ